ncbi:MAG: hypothetical protein WA997_04570 [Anaerolineales bacterium]|nr:hypothetical protein [Anaerolineales bacterium]
MSFNKTSNKKWGRQWVGIFGGGAIGWALTIVFPGLEAHFSLLTVLLWSAAIGGVLTSLAGFERAGAALTRRDNRALNILVGLGIPALLLLILFLVSR